MIAIYFLSFQITPHHHTTGQLFRVPTLSIIPRRRLSAILYDARMSYRRDKDESAVDFRERIQSVWEVYVDKSLNSALEGVECQLMLKGL